MNTLDDLSTAFQNTLVCILPVGKDADVRIRGAAVLQVVVHGACVRWFY